MKLHSTLALLGALALGVLGTPPVGAAPSTPQPEKIVLTTRDGVRIAAFWLDCHTDGAPAVLLLHNNGRDHFAWSSLLPRLQRAGMNVLALDLRGHGASRELAPEQYEKLVRREQSVYRAMIEDAAAGVDFLGRQKGIRRDRIAVVGGELGCSIGLALLAREPKLPGLVALSPGLNDFGYQNLESIRKYGKRPLFIFTTKRRLSEGPQALVDALHGQPNVQLALFPGNEARGVEMLGQPANIEYPIVVWLEHLFGLKP